MHRALTFFNRDELLLNHQLIDAKTEKAEKHQIFWNVPWKDQTLRGISNRICFSKNVLPRNGERSS